MTTMSVALQSVVEGPSGTLANLYPLHTKQRNRCTATKLSPGCNLQSYVQASANLAESHISMQFALAYCIEGQ